MARAPAHVEDPHLHRLAMLCDGVFAIALTLLTLDLKPPANWDGHDLLVVMAPKLWAYALSLLLISLLWTGHRRSFQSLVKADFGLDIFTLLFLGLVALLPPTTALTWEHPKLEAFEVYIGLIAITGVVQAIGWAYAAFVGKLVAPETPLSARIFVTVVTAVMPGGMCALSFYSTMTHRPWGWMLMGLLTASVVLGRRLLERRARLALARRKTTFSRAPARRGSRGRAKA